MGSETARREDRRSGVNIAKPVAFLFLFGLIRASLSTHPASEACQRRQPILLLLRTKMYEIASGCKKSVGVE